MSEKSPVGRPPEITKEWADSKAKGIRKLWAKGASFAEVCVKLGVCKRSYWKACSLSEQFSHADALGRLDAEAWWSKLGAAVASGGVKGNATVYTFNMKNRFGWKEKAELTGADDAPLMPGGEGGKFEVHFVGAPGKEPPIQNPAEDEEKAEDQG